LSGLGVLFANNLLPVFLVAGAGLVLGSRLRLNPKTLSQIIFYLFSPCLLFRLLSQSQLSNGDITRVLAFSAVTILMIGLLAWTGTRFLKLDRRLTAAVLITSMFMNAGNYGLPLTAFAFGNDALAYASLVFVANSILSYSLGIVIASLGTMSFPQAVWGLRKIPAVYAVGFGLLLLTMGWQLPVPLARSVEILGNAAIPSMLVLLGLQLRTAQWNGEFRPLMLVNGMRLLVAPLLALLMSSWFQLKGVAFQAGVLESSMPTAVLTTVLATEYEIEPAFVTLAVFTGTLLSPLTLTPLLAFLGA
jgi:predicted permease